MPIRECPSCREIIECEYNKLRSEGVQWTIKHLLAEAQHVGGIHGDSWRMAAGWIQHHNPFAPQIEPIPTPHDEGEIATRLNEEANGI